MAVRREQDPTTLLMKTGTDTMCLVFECRLNQFYTWQTCTGMGGEPVLKISIAQVRKHPDA